MEMCCKCKIHTAFYRLSTKIKYLLFFINYILNNFYILLNEIYYCEGEPLRWPPATLAPGEIPSH